MTRVITLLLNFCVAMVLLVATGIDANASIVYVTPTGAGLKNGTSWTNALDGNTVANTYYTKLRQAIYNAPAGTEFWIAKGTYTPHAPALVEEDTIAFILNKPLSLYGGFSGIESSRSARTGSNTTIIDGTTKNPAKWCKYLFTFSSVKEIYVTDVAPIIDGFTFVK